MLEALTVQTIAEVCQTLPPEGYFEIWLLPTFDSSKTQQSYETVTRLLEQKEVSISLVALTYVPSETPIEKLHDSFVSTLLDKPIEVVRANKYSNQIVPLFFPKVGVETVKVVISDSQNPRHVYFERVIPTHNRDGIAIQVTPFDKSMCPNKLTSCCSLISRREVTELHNRTSTKGDNKSATTSKDVMNHDETTLSHEKVITEEYEGDTRTAGNVRRKLSNSASAHQLGRVSNFKFPRFEELASWAAETAQSLKRFLTSSYISTEGESDEDTDNTQ